ncbi:MAG TPA: hypothetical protein VNU64_10825 [Burkholderiales bacterium]|nr:hypothetical protein [Burkholderiales bacterium]
MAVPDLRSVEAVPGGGDELVVGEMARQRGEAGIPEALLRPEAPGGDAAGGGAAGEKT